MVLLLFLYLLVQYWLIAALFQGPTWATLVANYPYLGIVWVRDVLAAIWVAVNILAIYGAILEIEELRKNRAERITP